MKKQIRRGVFETNSSSTHSLTICSEDTYEAWKKGELLFDPWNEEFAKSTNRVNKKMMEEAGKVYCQNRRSYQAPWKQLTEEQKSDWIYDNKDKLNIGDENEDFMTYDDWKDDYLESYVKHYTTEHGDKIIAFGQYGYDG